MEKIIRVLLADIQNRWRENNRFEFPSQAVRENMNIPVGEVNLTLSREDAAILVLALDEFRRSSRLATYKEREKFTLVVE
jgi:hypothetical protein